MNIAIIGSGNVGLALGKGLIKASHHVSFGVRNPTSNKAQKASQELPQVSFLSISESVQAAEVVIITTPPEAIIDLLPLMGNIHDKVIIDATNSIRTSPQGYATVFHAIQDLAGAEHVVKCFNTTGFENLQNPIYEGTGIDMFTAGSSPHAKQVAAQLALDIGFAACYDFGGDDKVELLEKFALSWINLAIMQGHGRGLAFKLLKR